jgi:hypothetical protein
VNPVERLEAAEARYEAAVQAEQSLRGIKVEGSLLKHLSERMEAGEEFRLAGIELDEAQRVYDTGIDTHGSLAGGAL